MNKQCFETRIVEAKNGVVVKIGCQFFVGTPQELGDLAIYYGHNVPERFKDKFRDAVAFRTDCPVADVSDRRANRGSGIPNWILGNELKLIKVTNGWIVVNNGWMWIVKDEDESIIPKILKTALEYDTGYCATEPCATEPCDSTTSTACCNETESVSDPHTVGNPVDSFSCIMESTKR